MRWLKNLIAKFQAWLNAKFTKRQQTIGVFAIILTLLIVGGILTLTENVPLIAEDEKEKEITAEAEKPTQGVKAEDVPEEEINEVDPDMGTGTLDSDDLVMEEAGAFDVLLEGAKEINVPLMMETKAEVVDSSEHYILFIGHAGVLSLYDKRDESLIQLDNPVDHARISDDEKFVAYTIRGALESDVRLYNMTKQLTEQIITKDNTYFSDIAMHDGMILFIFHEQNTENYELETFSHFDYREGRPPNTLARQKETNIGPKLYQNEDGVYYYHKADKDIKLVVPGWSHKSIAKVEIKDPGYLIVNDDNFAILDGGVIVTKSKRYEEYTPVDGLAYRDGVIHYIQHGGLFELKDGKGELLAVTARFVSVNKQDVVYQKVEGNVYIAP